MRSAHLQTSPLPPVRAPCLPACPPGPSMHVVTTGCFSPTAAFPLVKLTFVSSNLFPLWITISGSCNTREVVLGRDGTNVVTGSDCYPTSGTWFSPYDGATWTQASDLDIDHVVPLSDAWKSGANTWVTIPAALTHFVPLLLFFLFRRGGSWLTSFLICRLPPAASSSQTTSPTHS